MTKSLKINLMLVLTLLLSTITLFFCMLNTDVVKQAAADEEITVPTTYTVADKSDFYFIEGAQVNTEATGIRFKAEITKGYYDELTNNGTQEVVFYAVVNGASASAENAQIKPFAVQPTFAANAEDSETFSLFITIKYNEYIPTNGSFDKAYMTELLADAYVLKADNTWVKAYSPENNQRSMRVVANAAYLMQLEDEANGGSEEVEYKEQLANYFKSELTTRTSEEMAYILSNGSGKMYLPELSGDSYVGAYIGTKNVASTITDNVITLANVDLTDKNEGDLQNITALTKNGGLYTMKVAYATAALTLNTVDSILTATDGYYVLADDIDMSGKTWNPTNQFNGTLNGLGFAIENLKPSAQTGLFESLNGTAKNIFMKNVDTSAGSGVFGNRIRTASTIENVAVSFAKTTSGYAGGLFRILDFKKTLTLKDVVIVMPSRVTSETGFVAGRSNSEVVLDNCIFIGGNGQIAGTNASYVGTVSGTQNIYASVDALLEKLDKKEVTLSEAMTQKVYLAAGIQEINQNNAESIFKENASGYYILTGDITLSESYEAISDTKFTGTLDGRKHMITVKNGKGMFYDLAGTVKNVTIIKNTNTAEGYGAVAKRARDNAALDNVYLHVGGTIGNTGGGIVSVVLNKLTLNNVVVRTTMGDNASRGAVAYKGQTVTATNLYVIGALGISGNSYSSTPLKINDTVIDSADDRKLTGISITGVMFSSGADFKTFYTTGYNSLTEFLQSQCEKHLGAEKGGASSN